MPIDDPQGVSGPPVPKRSRVRGRLAVVIRNVVPLRKEPDHASEQVSQGLIGQPLVAEGGSKDWLFVQTWDTYRAWIHSRDLRLLDEGEQQYASSGPVAVVRELFANITSDGGEIITKTTISAELEFTGSSGDVVEVRLPDGNTGCIRKHDAKLMDKSAAQTIWLPEPRKLIETAMRFIGVPYLWGGASPFGLDCSGFVQLVHKIHGVTLLRDAHMQASDPRGAKVDRAELRAGDLVFFGKKREKKVTHVGMVIGGGRFIHCRGSLGVTITPLDSPDYSGIFLFARRMRFATLDPGGGAPEE